MESHLVEDPNDTTFFSKADCVRQLDKFFEHECSAKCRDHRRHCKYDPVVLECRQICANCPALLQCRYWSVVNSSQHGFQAGLTDRERKQLRFKMKKAGVIDPIRITKEMA